jgi:hypothetical protein
MMEPKIVRDEYGRPFFLHNAGEAWKVTDPTAEWGTWEPTAFSGIDFTNKSKEEPIIEEPVNKPYDIVVEAVIQETYSFIGELNDLILECSTDWERAKVYELLGDVAEDVRRFMERIGKTQDNEED